MPSFKNLGLSKEILKGIADMGFETPSDIQQEAIPHLIFGDRDFIGLAQTGTGKTAAFGLPLLDNLMPDEKYTQGLILSPTRELGKQIAEQLELYSKYMDKINVLPVYGGAAISNQIRALKKTQHVIIATPGRLKDLIKRKAIKLNQLRVLILDEADEMLNMGFKEDLDEILSYTPDDKATWLFSATMPKDIRKIVKKYMEDPIEVKVNTKNEVNANIEHRFALVKRSNKTEAMMRFMDINPDMRGVVFCRTKRDTQELAETLMQKGYKADALHGDLSQAQRDRVMKRFKSKKLMVLIATDVAARGIDVNDLSHVFHFTLPDSTEYYTHRSGRTARAGKEGISIAFVSGRDRSKIGRISNTLGISFEKIAIPSSDEIAELRMQKYCMEILEQKTKDRIDEEVLESAVLLFGNLSKEELIKKLLVKELSELDKGGGDLNDNENASRAPRRRGDRRSDGRRRGGGDRRRGGSGEGRKPRRKKDKAKEKDRKKRDGKSKSRYKGDDKSGKKKKKKRY